MQSITLLFIAILGMVTPGFADTIPVNVSNFVRAETDKYVAKAVKDDAFGRLRHRREPAPIDKQDFVRMNRDTLYSSGVFDLEAAPITVTLPDGGPRFMSLQVISLHGSSRDDDQH